MALLVIPLNKTHAVAAFDCGEPVLNQWLQTIAMQHQKNGASRTFALIDDAAPTVVLGFFTMAIRNFISSNELPVDLRKRLPRLYLATLWRG